MVRRDCKGTRRIAPELWIGLNMDPVFISNVQKLYKIINSTSFSSIIVPLLLLKYYSSLQLLDQQLLKSLTILGKLLDSLVELVPCHGILKKRPAEFRLVVDIGDLRDGVG